MAVAPFALSVLSSSPPAAPQRDPLEVGTPRATGALLSTAAHPAALPHPAPCYPRGHSLDHVVMFKGVHGG